MSNQPNTVHAALSADENSIDPLDEKPGSSPRHIAGLSLHQLCPQDTANPNLRTRSRVTEGKGTGYYVALLLLESCHFLLP